MSQVIYYRGMTTREDWPECGLGKKNDTEEDKLGVQLAEMRGRESVSVRDQSLFRLNRNCFVTER